MRKIPRVYIAGPFRAPTLAAVQRNIDVAAALRAPIAELGAYPVCPHIQEGLAMHDIQQANNGQFWVDATLEELRTCDAVVLVPGWPASVGTRGEVNEALNLCMPIYEASFEESAGLRPRTPSAWLRLKTSSIGHPLWFTEWVSQFKKGTVAP